MRAIVLVILLVNIFIISINGFHIGNRFGGKRIISTTSLSVSTAPIAPEYSSVIEQVTAGLKAKVDAGAAPQKFATILSIFLQEYAESNQQANTSPEKFKTNVMTFLKFVNDAITNPHKFSAFAKAIREPFDYYTWGNEFLKPLIIENQSKAFGLENAKKIQELINKGDNVVILSNHQTEADPQVLSILLEKEGMSAMAEKMIFIAGHKVTSDPVAIPFSMGRNLICIHSKKHIKNPPEDVPKKQAQNLESMNAMSNLFTQGGNVLWVAPSGGRDRPDASGAFVVSPYDVKALDMFKLLSMQTGKPVHFFPMAMYTHQLVPPPKDVSSELGETRSAKRGAVSVNFLDETNGIGGLKDKEFCADVEGKVISAYNGLVKFHAEVAKK